GGWLVWAAGFAICMASWARRSVLAIPRVREPHREELDALKLAMSRMDLRNVALRITSSDMSPGAWRGCVVLPDELSTRLSASELQAVLAHELAHVRRRDNLAAAVVRVIVSIFWFHPLLWWIER